MTILQPIAEFVLKNQTADSSFNYRTKRRLDVGLGYERAIRSQITNLYDV